MTVWIVFERGKIIWKHMHIIWILTNKVPEMSTKSLKTCQIQPFQAISKFWNVMHCYYISLLNREGHILFDHEIASTHEFCLLDSAYLEAQSSVLPCAHCNRFHTIIIHIYNLQGRPGQSGTVFTFWPFVDPWPKYAQNRLISLSRFRFRGIIVKYSRNCI